MAEREGFVCIFPIGKINVRLGPALAGDVHPRRIYNIQIPLTTQKPHTIWCGIFMAE